MQPSPIGSINSSEPSPQQHNASFALLCDYFDSPEDAVTFMRAFSGITLKVPSMKVVERLAKGVQIATALHRCPDTSTVRRLAELHSTPMRSIAKSFSKKTGEGLAKRRSRSKDTGNTSIPA